LHIGITADPDGANRGVVNATTGEGVMNESLLQGLIEVRLFAQLTSGELEILLESLAPPWIYTDFTLDVSN
jgi:hypothetical protein